MSGTGEEQESLQVYSNLNVNRTDMPVHGGSFHKRRNCMHHTIGFHRHEIFGYSRIFVGRT